MVYLTPAQYAVFYNINVPLGAVMHTLMLKKKKNWVQWTAVVLVALGCLQVGHALSAAVGLAAPNWHTRVFLAPDAGPHADSAVCLARNDTRWCW